MKRLAFVSVAGLIAIGLSPALAQERPNPNPQSGGEHAVARPSGGGSSSGSSASSPSSPSSPSGGGSGVGVDNSPGRGGERAVPRSGGSRRGGGSGGGAVRSGGSPKSVIIPANPQRRGPGDDREPNVASPRPRAGRPATGRAMPRDISNIPDLGWRRDPYWAYGYWRYNRWMPFYYGPWGGYMYYDPFWWDYYYGYYPGYYGGYAQTYSESDYDTGRLKLKVRPREAQVYVDGYFSGVVDDYDGVLQRLRLRAGAHRIELRLEGYEPAVFDVLIVAGETVTYRAELQRKP
ncbi:MAG TPA: PEGA domain-containing protein [Vicinamibacterales bacterium]|nr:PEGA domain-containing protein [Vicinamibacterales bacterium]